MTFTDIFIRRPVLACVVSLMIVVNNSVLPSDNPAPKPADQ